MKTPQIISKKIIYSNPWKKIILKTLKTKNNILQEYPINAHVGEEYATMIFPITSEGEIIYCKEWRPGIEDFVYSFPVGMQEPDISPENNAIKELKEEVGCISNNISYLGETIAGNFDTTIINYFFADKCILGKNNLEDGEYIEIQKSSIDDFEQKIVSGEINCPLTISCYTKAKLKKLI